MSQQFSEVVIDAPFLLVKGFLMGYMQGRGSEFPYFFHHKHGIKHETLGEIVKEALHLECHTRLCLPDAIIPGFREALAAVHDRIHTLILSEKAIKRASFSFSYHIYSEERSGPCKDVLKTLPEGVELQNYRPAELRSSTPVGVAEFSTINQYCYEGSGMIAGDFEGVMAVYLKIKRHSLCDAVLVSEIELAF
jgi:hypothetical protein